ncbi:MAG: competence/damage-inducible protein A [Lachnospiraceae bacterium]|jgi:nicotinamide-nucleotide amidase|nr:competence/damage-inducible protein A [Lachnospiraceae bacterium]
MTVEIICVGTELLLGNIVNTNAAYLSEKCAALGLSCYHQSVVGDNAKRLEEELHTAMSRSDILILTGGLGPTQDDLTKEVAAQATGKPLILHPESKERIVAYFEKRGMTPTENNWKQALIPEGAIVLDNDFGTAPGIIIETDHVRLILLPGPPGELIPLFEKSVIPYLSQLTESIILSSTVKICGLGESLVESMILDLIDSQSNPTIATYAKLGEVHIRLTAKADSVKEADALIGPLVEELRTRFQDSVYATEESVTLEQAIFHLLAQNNLTLTCAESCTGGMFAACITNVAGSSEVFKEGFITYSNKAKRRTLQVEKDTLKKYGAVSEKVAIEMSKGALQKAKADIAVAITGLAGPEGDGSDNPIGSVWIGIACGKQSFATHFHFIGTRDQIRQRCVKNALTVLRSQILQMVANNSSLPETQE